MKSSFLSSLEFYEMIQYSLDFHRTLREDSYRSNRDEKTVLGEMIQLLAEYESEMLMLNQSFIRKIPTSIKELLMPEPARKLIKSFYWTSRQVIEKIELLKLSSPKSYGKSNSVLTLLKSLINQYSEESAKKSIHNESIEQCSTIKNTNSPETVAADLDISFNATKRDLFFARASFGQASIGTDRHQKSNENLITVESIERLIRSNESGKMISKPSPLVLQLDFSSFYRTCGEGKKEYDSSSKKMRMELIETQQPTSNCFNIERSIQTPETPQLGFNHLDSERRQNSNEAETLNASYEDIEFTNGKKTPDKGVMRPIEEEEYSLESQKKSTRKEFAKLLRPLPRDTSPVNQSNQNSMNKLSMKDVIMQQSSIFSQSQKPSEKDESTRKKESPMTSNCKKKSSKKSNPEADPRRNLKSVVDQVEESREYNRDEQHDDIALGDSDFILTVFI